MHELSLLENVREILEDHAASLNFSKVTQVTLEIGKLSCVEAEALRFGFDVVMRDSLAENATLIITKLDGLGFCGHCQKQVKMLTLYDSCLHCGKPITEVIQGTEMKIKDLVVF
jgi:hydrogenase nickel incorporation protein HypA/HybF